VDQLKETVSQMEAEETAIVGEEAELLAVLHTMFVLTVNPMGRDALVTVLAMDLEPLLGLIAPTGTV